MKMDLVEQSRLVSITHKGDEVRMSMNVYREGRREPGSMEALEPFKELNAYIATKDEKFQDHVFSFFKETREIFDTVFEPVELNIRLSKEIERLYSIFDLNDVDQWVSFHAFGKTISYPPGILNKLNDVVDVSLITRDRTYLKEDYKELICFVIILRLIAPIWSEYITVTKSEYGTAWKEYYAFKLLHKAHIYRSHALERLIRYIEGTIKPALNLSSAVIGGISTEDYPIWLLAQALVRRVIMGDISGRNKPGDTKEVVSLVIVIYKYIEQRMNQTEEAFAGRVRTKNPPSEKQSDIDTMCALETYNTRQDVADGYIEMFNTYLENPFQVAKHLDPTIPDELIMQAIHPNYLNELLSAEINQGQMVLTQWVINEVVPARALDYIDKGGLVNAMGAVRAYLWHRGHYDLCALQTALEANTGNMVALVGAEKRGRISKEVQTELEKAFPYYRHVVNKTQKPTHNIINTINQIERYFTASGWRLTLPKEWLNQGRITNQGLFYSVQEDIKSAIAVLALEIASKESIYVKDTDTFEPVNFKS